MINISNYLDDKNEPFNSIWIDRILMVLEEDFSKERVEAATSWGVGGVYQMYRRQRSLTERHSKTKAFAVNLFAKVNTYFIALSIPCYKIKFCTVRLTVIHRP